MFWVKGSGFFSGGDGILDLSQIGISGRQVKMNFGAIGVYFEVFFEQGDAFFKCRVFLNGLDAFVIHHQSKIWV